MRILLLNDNHPPAVLAGAETSTVLLATALGALGHEVHVMARWPQREGRSPFEDSFVFHPVKCLPPTTEVGLAIKDHFVHPKMIRRAAMDLDAQVGPFDAVHANNAISGIALAGWRMPFRQPAVRVLSIRSYSQVCPVGHGYCLTSAAQVTCATTLACARHGHPAGMIDWAKAATLAFLYGPAASRKHRSLLRIDRLVADSEYVRRVAQNASGRNDISVIHEAVAPPSRSTEGGADVLFVGRLVAQKGCHILLEAFAKALPKLPARSRLVLAGDGGLRAMLLSRAHQLGIADSVDFLGYARGEALDAAYNRAGVLVVPSMWQEPFGIVAVEGLLRGIPLIASAVGGLADTARAAGSAAMTVPPGDIHALADGIVKIFAGDHRPTREVIERLRSHTDPTAVAKRHLAIYSGKATPGDEAPSSVR